MKIVGFPKEDRRFERESLENHWLFERESLENHRFFKGKLT